MNAFERQVADEVVQAVGPRRPVDDLAMFNHVVTTTQSPKLRFRSMFSATKFVVAGAIVALFGGFLLNGFLGTQQSEEPIVDVGATPSASPDGPVQEGRPGPITIAECDTRELRPEGSRASEGITGTWEASDARLSGLYTGVFSHNRTLVESEWLTLTVVAIRVENEDGAWQGPLYIPWDAAAVTDVAVLTGERGYEGLSAVIAYPIAPSDVRCLDFNGIVVESILTGVPEAYVTDGVPPPLINPVEMSLTDDGIEPAHLTFEQGPFNFVITNDGDTDHGLVVTVGEPPEYVAGYVDDLLSPGETRVIQVDLEDATEVYHLYDPTDESGTTIAFEIIEQ